MPFKAPIPENNNTMPGESAGGSIAAGVITLEWHLLGVGSTRPDDCRESPKD